MASHIVTVSPKGQITIPVQERKKIKAQKYLLEVIGNTITMKPIRIEIIKDDTAEIAKLSEQSFDFWDNKKDDIYQKFYQQ